MSVANQRVMFVAAHPDDPEFLAGGTIAGMVKDGCEVSYVIVTNGNKGSGDRTVTSEQLAPIRETEQRRAARVLGSRTWSFSAMRTASSRIPATCGETSRARSDGGVLT